MPRGCTSWRLLAALVVFTSLMACDPEPASAPTTDAMAGPNAAIIRSPIDGSKARPDSTQVARMTFVENTFTFGTVRAGEVVEHDFHFSNTGTQPLLITSARSTCGCTVSEYPKEAIGPGGTGTIRVRFDTRNKVGHQRKPVNITANTYPSVQTIYLDGQVTKE